MNKKPYTMRSLASGAALAFLTVMAAGSLASCRSSRPLVTFVVASDLHAQDVPDGRVRMEAVVNAANRQNADFLIELGDFVRLDSAGQRLLRVWEGYAGPKYHVLGNHDVDRYTKEEYTAGMDMPGRYYSFDHGDFHFVVLDGDNLYDGQTYTPYARGNYGSRPSDIDYVDPEQLDWLRRDLAATDKRCILFSHQSIDTQLKNGAAVREVLEAENRRAGCKKVVLALSGHNHSNYTKVIGGITYMQINSASYVWVGSPTQTERRYPADVNRKYGGILKYSMTYTRPLYATVTLTRRGAKIKGVEADFVPPTPREIGLGDSLGVFPLTSSIADAEVRW